MLSLDSIYWGYGRGRAPSPHGVVVRVRQGDVCKGSASCPAHGIGAVRAEMLNPEQLVTRGRPMPGPACRPLADHPGRPCQPEEGPQVTEGLSSSGQELARIPGRK